MLLPIYRLVTRLSVRARIVGLAIIPVIGFMANVAAFVFGEAEVTASFEHGRRATDLANASQEFKAALSSMRIYARDFGARPNEQLIKAFGESHAAALRSLAAIDIRLDVREKQNLIPLRTRLNEVIGNFGELARSQEQLGFTESDGTRRR